MQGKLKARTKEDSFAGTRLVREGVERDIVIVSQDKPLLALGG
jgi:hypothetical protein